MRPIWKKSMLTGAIAAIIVSIFHSQIFRLDVFGWSGLIAWYLLSLLVGCGAGFAAALLTSLTSSRQLKSLIAYFGGAVFGALGYLIQVYLLLLHVFSRTTWD